MELLFEKSRVEAVMLKTSGNNGYRKQKYSNALDCYTMAIQLCPHSIENQERFLTESMEMLRRSSPQKHAVAKDLYYAAAGTVNPPVVEEDHTLKQSMLTTLLPEVGRDGVTTPPGHDPLLAQCFGNRSAVLCEMKLYKECLADIERALEHGFPSESAHKLEARREKCKAALLKENSSSLASSSIPSMSAFQSDAVSVASSPDVGRHLKAARDIRAGEVVIAEDAYVAVLNPHFLSTHCSYCLRESPNSILPCIQCPCEGYCSAKCRLEAWVKYHWLECKLTTKWRKAADWTEVMCLRIVASADPADILRACKGLEVTGDYGLIFNLIAHEMQGYDCQKVLLSKAALNLNLCFGEELRKMCSGAGGGELPAELDEPSLNKLLCRHLQQLRYNSHSVSSLMECEQSGELCREPGKGLVRSERPVSYGTVILPTASLINHSCAPNAIFRFEGRRVLVCVTKDLKKGEEINNCYLPYVGHMKTAERRKELLENYSFHCQCPACLGMDPVLSLREAARDGLACKECDSGAMSEGKEGYSCCLCEATLSGTQLKKILKKKKEAEGLQREASKQGDLRMLLDCLKIQSSILHKHNLSLGGTYDLIAQQYAARGAADMACRYLEKSYETVGVIFGKDSIEYANESKKLASVCFNGDDYKKALRAAEKAKSIFSIYYGPSHSDYKDMSELAETIRSLSLHKMNPIELEALKRLNFGN